MLAAPPWKPAIACTSREVEPSELEPVGVLAAKPPTCQSRPTVPRNEAPVICIIIDVVDFQSASTTVTQDQVALGAVIADTCHLPVQADPGRRSRGCC